MSTPKQTAGPGVQPKSVPMKTAQLTSVHVDVDPAPPMCVRLRMDRPTSCLWLTPDEARALAGLLTQTATTVETETQRQRQHRFTPN